MRALAISMALLLGSTAAYAGSELQLKSSMPVVLILDGESLGTVQPIEPLLVDIEPGVHNLQIKGLMGKDLYDRDLIFDDDTRTELVWQRKELRLGGVVQLDPNRQEDDGTRVAEADGTEEDTGEVERDLGSEAADRVAEAEPPPVDMEHEEPEPEQVAVSDDAERPPLKRPTAPPQKPRTHASTDDPFSSAPPVRDVETPKPVPSGRGSVVIEATPGMDLQVTHGTQKLRITVQNGELVVEDANGTEIHFPGDGTAF